MFIDKQRYCKNCKTDEYVLFDVHKTEDGTPYNASFCSNCKKDIWVEDIEFISEVENILLDSLKYNLSLKIEKENHYGGNKLNIKLFYKNEELTYGTIDICDIK